VHTSGEGGADVRDGRFSRRRIQSGELDRGVGARAVQEFVDRIQPRPELGCAGKAARIEGRTVPQRLDRDDPEWKRLALRFQQPRERPPYVSISD